MASKTGNSGYIGRVPNAGAAAVSAPNQKTVSKKVSVHRGGDLRTGGKKQ